MVCATASVGVVVFSGAVVVSTTAGMMDFSGSCSFGLGDEVRVSAEIGV